MATPPTNKKIQRVQQSGVSRRTGQRRPMGFGAAVVAIIVIGTALVLWARHDRLTVGGDEPRANQDKWYEAYGTYVCDDYEPNPATPTKESDISTLGNGIISIFPSSSDSAGDNAVIGKFFDAAGFKVSDTSFTTPDGTTHKAGDACGAGSKKTTKTVVKLFIWPPQASDKTKPEIIDSDFGAVRFAQSKGFYALALVPESTKTLKLPPSGSNLANPEASAVPAPTTTEAPPTTAAGATTTAPAATTTAAPAATTTAEK